MFKKNSIPNLRKGPSGVEVLKIHAISRIALNNWIPNIQVSVSYTHLPSPRD